VEENVTRKQKLIKWVKRLGFWGFIFFLLKGLAWIAVGYFGVTWLDGCS
jgi:hypothetical protein